MQHLSPTHWLSHFSTTSDPLDAARVSAPQLGHAERELRLAVLFRAWLDLSVRKAARRNEAAEYFFSEDESHGFAFVSLCEVLDLDAVKIRAACRAVLDRAGGLAELQCNRNGCGIVFTQRRKHMRFCSRICEKSAYNALQNRLMGALVPYRSTKLLRSRTQGGNVSQMPDACA